MESEVVLIAMALILAPCAVLGVHIYTARIDQISQRRERELSYREELKNMRMGAQIPQRSGNDETSSELGQIIGLLSDPSVQTILKTVLSSVPKQPPQTP